MNVTAPPAHHKEDELQGKYDRNWLATALHVELVQPAIASTLHVWAQRQSHAISKCKQAIFTLSPNSVTLLLNKLKVAATDFGDEARRDSGVRPTEQQPKPLWIPTSENA